MLLKGKGAILSVLWKSLIVLFCVWMNGIIRLKGQLLFLMIQSEAFHNIRTQNYVLTLNMLMVLSAK